MQAFQRVPTGTWPHRKSGEDLLGRGIVFVDKAFQGFREYSQFLQKPGALREKDMMEEIIPGCCRPRCFAAKKVGFQGAHPRDISKMTPAVGYVATGSYQLCGELREQVGRHRNILPSTYQFAPTAHRNRVIERHARHSVKRFPSLDYRFK